MMNWRLFSSVTDVGKLRQKPAFAWRYHGERYSVSWLQAEKK
jgi:hypothetical protein